MLILACLVAMVAVLGWWQGREDAPQATSAPEDTGPAEVLPAAPTAEAVPAPITTRESRGYLVALKSLERLKTPLAQEQGRPNEAVLVFKDADAFQRFLKRAAACGLKVLARLDRMHAVRVGYDSLDALSADLAAYADDYGDIDANYFVYPPDETEIDPRFAGKFVPIGNGLLDFLGVSGDSSKWGAGVTIAVLDSGVVADPTFGTGRLRFLDIGLGTAPFGDNGHGTSVASLAGGAAPDAVGIAQASNLLSIRVTTDDGLSDSFTLARGIMSAVDGGSNIVNVSMGSYSSSFVMLNAIDYATKRGALVVASAGNDQATQLTWPAADSRVISVGAVDAAEQQVMFSNAGDGLKITAPGFGLQTAWINGQRVYVDGTSGSAPVVAGSIAAMMSQNPGFTPMQAWNVLQQYASDGGTLGPDPDYGAGILNLGWAMNRNNFNRIDTAVSSQFFDPRAFEMQLIVQNRSGRGVGGPGFGLDVNVGGGSYHFDMPWLAPGGTHLVRVPVDYFTLQAYGRVDYRTNLTNPSGFIDVLPSNNSRTNIISVTKSQ